MFVNPSRIAHMYYEEGLKQQEIANRVGISRIQVSRILQQAKADGTVTISIRYDGFFPELEASLTTKYPDVTFVVCDSLDGSGTAIKQSIGSSGADYLDKHAKEGMDIAVGWGTTLRELSKGPIGPKKDITFIPLIGGQIGAGLDVHANSIAERLARKTGGNSRHIFAPAVAESIEARNHFVTSAPLAETLRRAASADMAIFSVGSPFGESTTIPKIGYFTEAEVAYLRDSGAVCDVISIIYFDSKLKECGQELSSRTVSITSKQLFDIPTKVCIAGGSDKHEAVRVALDIGVVDVLVTDDLTARYLIA